MLFLSFHLQFLISAVIAQMFNLNAEVAIPIWMKNNNAKAEIETDTVIETKISAC